MNETRKMLDTSTYNSTLSNQVTMPNRLFCTVTIADGLGFFWDATDMRIVDSVFVFNGCRNSLILSLDNKVRLDEAFCNEWKDYEVFQIYLR